MKLKEIREKLKEILGGVPSKCLILQLLNALEHQTGYQIYAKARPIYLMIRYPNYLIIIFMNINENH